MRVPSRRIGRAFWFGATAAIVAVLTVAAVTSSAVGAAPKPSRSQIGPGYPPPGGIYTLFTNCPLNNPLMHESVTFAACVAGYATSGSITIGNITTPVVRPVNVQFGFWTGPNQTYYADAVPPIAGLSAILSTKPDLIPQSLTTMLGCPSTNSVVENLCQEAKYYGGKYLDVYALAQEDWPDHELRSPQLDAAGDLQADQPAPGQYLLHRDDRQPGRAQPIAHPRQRRS